MSTLAVPYANARAERVMKLLKVEEVALAGYETIGGFAARLPLSSTTCTTQKERIGLSATSRPMSSSQNSPRKQLKGI
jgi:hypothetical protein